MAYLDLMILMSRYILVGFGVIFTVITLSFMDPFIPIRLGDNKSKNGVLYFCTLFFFVGGAAIILATNPQNIEQEELLTNSLYMFSIITLTVIVLRLLGRHSQLVIWQIVCFLMAVSYVMLQRLDHQLATLQIKWFAISLFVGILLIQAMRGLIRERYKYMYLILTVVNICLPFVFGKTVNGATNWVQIGPFSFQPSEFAKISFVLYLAALCATYKEDSKRAVIEGIGVTGAIMLILMLQTDLGGALLFYLIFLIMLMVMRGKWGLSLLGIGGIGIGGFVGYQLFGHVRIRVMAWLDPWADISGTGYQVAQGLFAIGTWGWLGSGLTRGTPYKIPYVTTDYIFAAIGEELGNLFLIVIIIMYLAMVLYGLKVSLLQKSRFNQSLAIGLVAALAFQAMIIIGGILKIIPLTGVTLPFISYGGSSVLASVLMIGILSVLHHETRQKAKEEGKNET